MQASISTIPISFFIMVPPGRVVFPFAGAAPVCIIT
jgi:hypothetical protein